MWMWFKLLCNVYIKPHLEFCVQAWSPYFKQHIDCMEKVQHRVTKMVYGFGNLKYEERLERPNLLQYRRMRGDMIETYKILSGLEDVNSSQFFTRLNMNNFRGHSLKQYKEHIRKIIQKEFFTQREVDQWNWLPEEVVQTKTLNSFKNLLDKYWRRYRH